MGSSKQQLAGRPCFDRYQQQLVPCHYLSSGCRTDSPPAHLPQHLPTSVQSRHNTVITQRNNNAMLAPQVTVCTVRSRHRQEYHRSKLQRHKPAAATFSIQRHSLTANHQSRQSAMQCAFGDLLQLLLLHNNCFLQAAWCTPDHVFPPPPVHHSSFLLCCGGIPTDITHLRRCPFISHTLLLLLLSSQHSPNALDLPTHIGHPQQVLGRHPTGGLSHAGAQHLMMLGGGHTQRASTTST